MRNTADSRSDAERFVKRVAAADQVWYLSSADGPAVSESLDCEDDDGPLTVLLFFSDRAYAKRAQTTSFPGFEPQSMALFDFMFRWLPGMSRDQRLAGPNWTGDLVGLEIDPFELREQIEAAMTPEHRERHLAEFQRLTSG